MRSTTRTFTKHSARNKSAMTSHDCSGSTKYRRILLGRSVPRSRFQEVAMLSLWCATCRYVLKLKSIRGAVYQFLTHWHQNGDFQGWGCPQRDVFGDFATYRWLRSEADDWKTLFILWCVYMNNLVSGASYVWLWSNDSRVISQSRSRFQFWAAHKIGLYSCGSGYLQKNI